MNTTIFIFGILLQAVAAGIALLQVRSAPRKLPWLLISLSLLLIVVRRAAILEQSMAAGKELDAAEILTLIISLLFFLGVLLMARMFREIREDTVQLQQSKYELYRSEKKYRELVENANSIILRRKPGGEITFINKFAEKFFGFSKEEILGKSLLGTIVPERDRTHQDLQLMVLDIGVNPESYVRNENENMRKDGSRVWVGWTNRGIRDAAGNITEILAVGTDITGRKQAEDMVLKVQQRLDFLLSHLYAGVLSVSEDDRVEYVNQAFCDLYNLCETPAELRGLPSSDMIQKILPAFASPGDVYAFIQRVVAQKTPVRGEEIAMLDGRFCLVDHIPLTVEGRSCGRIWHHQDITMRKLMERALQFSEEKFRKAFMTSPDAIIITRLSDGTFVSVNAGFTVMSGYTEEEVYGKTTMEINIWENPRDRERMVELLKTKGSIKNFETCFVTKAGIVHSLLSAAIIELNGESHILVINRDITALKRAEEELQAKNAELTNFNYTVSHDLKSPLVTIKTFLGYLEKDMAKADAEHVVQDLGYIHGAAEKMNALLEELLDLSRIGRVINPPVEVPLKEIVEEALDLAAGRLAGRGAQVVVEQEPLLIYGDRPRLVEVFQNLVDNAVKFMGGQPEPLIEIGAETKNGEITCFVRDNGMGIDPRQKINLFGFFARLNPGIEGTGLGLALVKRIVEMHGGRIWAESEGPGKGACFWFSLPGKPVQS
jgi:PAS domain S-box-containing protein